MQTLLLVLLVGFVTGSSGQLLIEVVHSLAQYTWMKHNTLFYRDL